jgi:hypothetical protein
MKKRVFIFLFSLSCLFVSDIQAQDSLSNKKNLISLELFGNGYQSPFMDLPNGTTFFSLEYARTLTLPNCSWQFCGGAGAFKSAWIEPYVSYIHPSHPDGSLSAGFLFGHYPNAKSYGLWVGLFFSAGIGKQQYTTYFDYQYSRSRTVNFDFQVVPNLCYQFSSRNRKIVCKVSFTPRISSSALQKVFFIPWGGIRIGGAW